MDLADMAFSVFDNMGLLSIAKPCSFDVLLALCPFLASLRIA